MIITIFYFMYIFSFLKDDLGRLVGLDGLGESDLFATEIEDGGVSGDEDISQDEVDAEAVSSLETRNALICFSILSRNNENVIVSVESEVFSVEDERDGGKLSSLAAVDGAVGAGANLLIQFGKTLRGTNDQRGSSVGNGGARESQRLAGDLDVREIELPVGLRGEWNIGEVSSEAVSGDFTEGKFTTGGLAHPFVQPKSEQWLLDKSLGDQVVPDWSGSIDRNGIESHSENSVEGGVNESGSRFVNGFGKVLTLDGKAGNRDAVLADETSQRSSSVLNGEGGSVGLVSGRRGAVVFLVGLASFV